jgi:hypothetical protein
LTLASSLLSRSWNFRASMRLPLVASKAISFVFMALAVLAWAPLAGVSSLILAGTHLLGFELKALGNARVSNAITLAFSIVQLATATIILTGILTRNRFMALAVAIVGRAPLAGVSSLILVSARIHGFKFKALSNARVSNPATLAFSVVQLATKITGRVDNRHGGAKDDKRRELHDNDLMSVMICL